jgi:hypothetical protein
MNTEPRQQHARASGFVGYVAIVITIIFISQTTMRELGVPTKYLPFQIIKYGGQLVEACYYYAGACASAVMNLFETIWRFIIDNLWSAIVQTLRDFVDAVTPYFNFSEFLYGLIDYASEYWAHIYKSDFFIFFVWLGGSILFGLLCVVCVMALSHTNHHAQLDNNESHSSSFSKDEGDIKE